jgi:hypothetical protein
MRIGTFLAMDDENFEKATLENEEMKQEDIATILISAFGDGK